MMKYRHNGTNEIVEAIKWDGNIETVKNNKWLYDALKEEKIILATNYINNKEIVFIKSKSLFGEYLAEIKENNYIINENGKLRKLNSKIFEEIFEVVEENKDDSNSLDLEFDTKEKLNNLLDNLNEVKKKFEELEILISNEKYKDSFKVITKDIFISQHIGLLDSMNKINHKWDKISKGYNFVLFKKDINNENRYFSVEKFNELFKR